MIWNWNWCWFEAAGGYRATILTFCISLRPKLGECSTIIGSFWKIGADISLALESCLLRMCSFRAFCVMYDLQHFWHLFPLSTAQFRLCLSKLYDDEKFWLQPPHTWVLLVRFFISLTYCQSHNYQITQLILSLTYSKNWNAVDPTVRTIEKWIVFIYRTVSVARQIVYENRSINFAQQNGWSNEWLNGFSSPALNAIAMKQICQNSCDSSR